MVLKDFHNELVAIMNEGNFSDMNDLIDVENRILNDRMTEEDKKRIINQQF